MRSVVNSIRRVCIARVSTVGVACAVLLVLTAGVAASGAESVEIAGLNVPRAGHTGTRLSNGDILIAGGENDTGPVLRTETFHPSSRSFSLAGNLESGRVDHTATLLSDGSVFLIGGRSGDRALDTTETSADAGASFENGPALNRARYGHSATLLPDGRIVVVGGDSGGTIEVLDPESHAFRLLEPTLSVPREFHAAALLHDGRILIAGGVDLFDGKVVASAEILDLAAMTISAAASPMRTPRTRFALNVLPDGKVQAIGGDAEVSMEMFNPGGRYFTARARLLDGAGALSATLSTPGRSAVLGRSLPADPAFGTGDRTLSARSVVTILTPDALDRIEASVTRNPSAGFALATGGLRAAGVLSETSVLTGDSAATVTTDKTDYSPGDTVVITGAGWMPGETVSMLLHQDDGDPDLTLTSVSDDSGNFVNSDFVVDMGDLGATFLLTATGLSSGYTAQTTFTDANPGLNISGKDGGQHGQVNAEEDLGNIAQGTSLSLTCPRGTGLTVKATGLGGSSSETWVLGYSSVYGNDSTLSPLTTLNPSSGTLSSSSDTVCVATTITTSTLSVGTTYHGQLHATGTSGTSTPTADYFFKFTVTAPACSAPSITTCPPDQHANADAG
ncbi:MAG TPA: kelch repeat-containing protein, partial [Thermoanaerobaculia bacterium]|nr:kelch repeat-containing protein [Thermoanaerobaculia bacterium]